ncbi:MAG: hypothetical protein R6X23_01740, partial [Acidimicrobiia bacterium]
MIAQSVERLLPCTRDRDPGIMCAASGRAPTGLARDDQGERPQDHDQQNPEQDEQPRRPRPGRRIGRDRDTTALESGKKVMYTSDGDYTRFIDDIAGCGVHGFVLEPWTDMQLLADHYGTTHAFIGNADTR